MKKILVIDDNPEVVKLLKSRLEGSGYFTIVAYDGEEGLAKTRSDNPDLIILDILMPKIDGYTFIRELKTDKNTKNIPVIIVSAKDKMKDLFALEGVSDYFVKPFKAEDLLARIDDLLRDGNSDINT